MLDSSTKPFSGIFVSYRRDDSSGHAGRLFDRLVEHFGKDRIFMDIDTIEPGEDFVTVIHEAVASCEILIAVIGQNWLSGSSGVTGRLDNPNDWVRLEIGAALSRNIRVIPVLVKRATMPRAEDLPDDLSKLLRRNAVELSDLRWHNDVTQLIGVMEKVLSRREDADTRHALEHLRSEEENRARAEKEHLRQSAEETEQALHANSEDKQPGPDLAAGGIVVSIHEAQPPNSYPLLDKTSATMIRQSPGKRTMLLAIAACVAVLAIVAVIWVTQRPDRGQQPANVNPTLAVAQPTDQPTATSKEQPTVSPKAEPSAEPTEQPTVSPELEPTAKEYFERGRRLLNEKNYAEAEKHFLAAWRLDQKNAEYSRYVSITLRGQDKYKDAGEFAWAAWRREPTNPNFNNELCMVLLGQKKYPEAEKYCREAVQLNPDDAAFHSNLGAALLLQHRFEEAKGEYNAAIRLDPADASYKEMLSKIP